MKGIETKDILQKKTELENRIEMLIGEFERETGLIINSLELVRYDENGASFIGDVQTKITIPKDEGAEV